MKQHQSLIIDVQGKRRLFLQPEQGACILSGFRIWGLVFRFRPWHVAFSPATTFALSLKATSSEKVRRAAQSAVDQSDQTISLSQDEEY